MQLAEKNKQLQQAQAQVNDAIKARESSLQELTALRKDMETMRQKSAQQSAAGGEWQQQYAVLQSEQEKNADKNNGVGIFAAHQGRRIGRRAGYCRPAGK
jgi:hypothetical protein